MNEGREVTIKAYELDQLLQLALVGNQLRSHSRNARPPADAVEPLQGLDIPQVRERAGLMDPHIGFEHGTHDDLLAAKSIRYGQGASVPRGRRQSFAMKNNEQGA